MSKKKYVIFDLDGTLTLVGDRREEWEKQPRDYERFFQRCDEDKPNPPVQAMVAALFGPYRIVFCTGRSTYPTVQEKTEEQIRAFTGIPARRGQNLFMRSMGDHRPDTTVKPELLAGAGITPENTLCIFEDRNTMVNRWRELGFTCFQVAPGVFDGSDGGNS